MVNIKNLTTFEKGYLLFILIVGLALATLIYLEKNEMASMELEKESLQSQYDFDESKGEYLVECMNGSLDVVRPQEPLLFVCGQSIDRNLLN